MQADEWLWSGQSRAPNPSTHIPPCHPQSVQLWRNTTDNIPEMHLTKPKTSSRHFGTKDHSRHSSIICHIAVSSDPQIERRKCDRTVPPQSKRAVFSRALNRWSNCTLIDYRIHSNRFSRLRALLSNQNGIRCWSCLLLRFFTSTECACVPFMCECYMCLASCAS